MIRTPKAGEIWIWKKCEFHNQLVDVVTVGVDFEDQPEVFRQHILGRLYCGCQYPADDPEAAILELRKWEAEQAAESRRRIESVLAKLESPPAAAPPTKEFWWWFVVVLLCRGTAFFIAGRWIGMVFF